jgi:hypothetical protein
VCVCVCVCVCNVTELYPVLEETQYAKE